MKELNDIIRVYDKAVLQNKQTALVTVVRVDGSSYRRPGARMLVTDDGMITGAITRRVAAMVRFQSVWWALYGATRLSR